jgi:hypothetical protein
MRLLASLPLVALLFAAVPGLAPAHATVPALAAEAGMAASDNNDSVNQVLVMLAASAARRPPGGGYAAAAGRSRGARQPAWRKAEAIARAHGLQLLAGWPMPSLGLDCYVMRIGTGSDRERVLRELAGDPRLQWAQAMQQFRVLGSGDPLYVAQPTAKLWHLRELHAFATGKGVLLAQIDSGVAVEHPDLRGQVPQARNFVPGEAFVGESHGTEVAGIISARADNGLGIAGVAPQARLLALRACWQLSDGAARCSSFSLAQALQYALHARAQVINLSLSGPPDRLLARLLDAALEQGSAVVAAADPGAADGGFPAAHAGVLAVAADGVASPLAKLLRAPGQGIPTTEPGDTWGMVSGSSFAAAQITGLAALLLQLRPSLRPAELQHALAAGSGPLAARPGLSGVDACAAIAQARHACACDCASAPASLGLQP